MKITKENLECNGYLKKEFLIRGILISKIYRCGEKFYYYVTEKGSFKTKNIREHLESNYEKF